MKRALAVAVLLLALPASAHASARTVNEPDTTKPVAQPDLTGTVGNTWWFEITLPDHPSPGSPGNCGTTYGYSGTTQSCPRYVYCLKYRDTNTSTYTSGNCWFAPGTLQTVAQNANAKWYARLALGNLTSGHTYEACVDFEYYDYTPPAGWVPLQTYMCESTKIDSGAPTTSLTIDNGDTWTSNPNLSVRITYSDAVSAAWPSSFMCAGDSGCTSLGSFSYDSVCSNYPASGQSCTRNFDGSDGLQRQCVSVADSAVPDNPATTASENGFTFHDQFAQATANFANLSSIACDTISLDSGGPDITMGGDPAVGTALQTTTFTASSTDTGIGPTNSFLWDFGDGDTRTGKTIGHTYVNAGTYTVKVTNTDQLGNSSTKQISYTVNPVPSTGGGGTDPGAGGGGSGWVDAGWRRLPAGPTPGARRPAVRLRVDRHQAGRLPAAPRRAAPSTRSPSASRRLRR